MKKVLIQVEDFKQANNFLQKCPSVSGRTLKIIDSICYYYQKGYLEIRFGYLIFSTYNQQLNFWSFHFSFWLCFKAKKETLFRSSSPVTEIFELISYYFSTCFSLINNETLAIFIMQILLIIHISTLTETSPESGINLFCQKEIKIFYLLLNLIVLSFSI